ncbi:MAG: hypothetical protein IJ254_06170 [Succinivibrio sp.]|jgi:predicted Holliday junction resolvase-like endonuclease|nr:hypothetical protein [Succinivibrio sp.]
MSFWLILVIAVPILFVVGTTYNAIKEQKKLENGVLKTVLQKREEEKRRHLKMLQRQALSKSQSKDPINNKKTDSRKSCIIRK